MDYWEECIRTAFEDSGITATEEQILEVSETVKGSFENYGLYHGHECIPNPLSEEVDRLKKELRNEKDKVFCEECNGKGMIVSPGPYHSGVSQCHKCNGEGRHNYVM